MQALATGIWRVDTTRTTARFTAVELGVWRVSGTITVVEGTVDVDGAGTPTGARAVLDPATIATGNSRRDADLRGRHFLKVDGHPRIAFEAATVAATGGGWRVTGTLQVAGTAAPIELAATTRPGNRPGERLVTARGRLDRRAAGVRAPAFLIGRWVDVTIEAVLTAPVS